jgi:hypothetical protein
VSIFVPYPLTRFGNPFPRRQGLSCSLRSSRLDGCTRRDRGFSGPLEVETHVNRVFSKLGLLPEGQEHRRVAAVLAYLRSAAS